jgi:hypothetical protein
LNTRAVKRMENQNTEKSMTKDLYALYDEVLEQLRFINKKIANLESKLQK